MPNIKQAKKRVRQAEASRMLNKHHRSTMRTAIKKVETAAIEGNKEQASDALKGANAALDRMVSKGIVHKNNAARKKRRLNKQVQAL